MNVFTIWCLAFPRVPQGKLRQKPSCLLRSSFGSLKLSFPQHPRGCACGFIHCGKWPPPEAEEQSLEKTGTKGLWIGEADVHVAAETPRPAHCYNFSSLLKLRCQPPGRDC